MPKKKQQPLALSDLIGGNPTDSANVAAPKDVRAELLHSVEVLNKLLFSPKAKLRDAARAVNEMLTTVENILLSAFFKEYEKWIVESGGDINNLPDKLVTLGEKIHKLIVARGKLVMDMMQQIREDEMREEEASVNSSRPASAPRDLFSLPQEVSAYLEGDDNETD